MLALPIIYDIDANHFSSTQIAEIKGKPVNRGDAINPAKQPGQQYLSG
jgi:hypothetical protein